MLKALVGSFAAFLAALFLSAASASAQDQGIGRTSPSPS